MGGPIRSAPHRDVRRWQALKPSATGGPEKFGVTEDWGRQCKFISCYFAYWLPSMLESLECLPLVASFRSSFSSIFHFISFLIVVLYHCYVELARHRCRTYRYFVSCYDTIRYGIEYLTCSEKLTCSQLSPAHGTNRKIKEKKRTKNKSTSMI